MTVASGITNGTGRFPTVESVTVEWEECDRAVAQSQTECGAFPHVMRTTGGTFKSKLPCSNPDCRDGGFEIVEVIDAMVSNRREEKDGLLVCIGWERPKGRQRAGQSPCTRVISYRIRLTYRKKGSAKPAQTKQHDWDT